MDRMDHHLLLSSLSSCVSFTTNGVDPPAELAPLLSPSMVAPPALAAAVDGEDSLPFKCPWPVEAAPASVSVPIPAAVAGVEEEESCFSAIATRNP